MNPVLISGGIVAALGLAQAAARIPVSRRGRAKRNRVLVELQDQCDAGLDRIVIGPLAAVYNGASARYSSIAGNATVVLTEQKLLWIKRTGAVVEVPRSRIVGTRMAARFNGRAEAGRRHLVIQTSDPAELGMYVIDPGRWEAMLDPGRREAMLDPGRWEAMLDPGRREAMLDPGRREAMLDPGRREAMLDQSRADARPER